ncbi:MAG: FAD-binding protein, partial [Acidobacteria bacterium]|nr:FAD-binding protein [Acidobacteriota bacterium]
NRVLEVNLEERWARIEPGLVLDRLNAHLRPLGAMFGPDVSTSNRATLGGMIGNNSCGARSVIYGMTIDHVTDLRALLADGTGALFGALSAAGWQAKCNLGGLEGSVYRTADRLAAENREEILARFPKIMRHVGGYNLDRFVNGAPRNLCNLLVGSEGTLATYTEAVVRLVPAPKCKVLGIVHFDDLVAAMEAVEEILPLDPAAVEMVDRMVLDLTRRQPAFARKMTFIEGDPAAVLVVEYCGESPKELQAKLNRLERTLQARGTGSSFIRAETAEAQANVWAIRKAGTGLLSSVRGDAKPIAFVEDTAVPTRNLGRYVSRFMEILDRHGARAGLFGHASVGCLHIRPLINLKVPDGIRKMVDIATEVKNLVVEYGGSMSGEHGDGIVRSHFNRELFGDRIYSAFRELKAAFDPAGIMNPGKIVDAPPMTSFLRYGPDYQLREPQTYLDFTLEGGFAGAIEQCSGMGECRKEGTGTMCPSYMATRDEEHSTRGRANALRAAISGRLPQGGLASRRLFEALDLCLECKACKTECPANVDMAKLKFEFLAQWNDRYGIPLRSRLFANIAALSRIGSVTAPVSNWVLGSSLFRHTIQRMLGIDPRRTLPSFSRRSFRRRLRRRSLRAPRRPDVKIVFFTDTFANYCEPDSAGAALALLESTGAEIHIPELVCCGRPMISKGLLAQARENARINVERLRPLVESGAFIVGCEPSCILTLRDEYPDLLSTEDARAVARNVMLLEELLVRLEETGDWQPSFAATERTILLHGHCHQKSLVGTNLTARLLRKPPGFEVTEIDSGCCGMAGAFGYEREHYDISMQIGELSLFPAIRRAPAAAEIVAAGISCRQQILAGTGRSARHFAEVLAGALIN